MTNVTHSRLVRMSIKKVDGPQDHHRFIDEAGDMTFHSGKRGRKTSSIGMDGVSRCFIDRARTCEKSPRRCSCDYRRFL